MKALERLLVLTEQDGHTLGTVRTQPGLRVAQTAGQIWLRGLPATGELALVLRQLPAVSGYSLNAQNQLFPSGSQTPTGLLPEVTWQPILDFVPLEIPVAALPGQLPTPHHWQLIAATYAPAGSALLTTLPAWKAYADTAPEIRLQQLRFAVSATNEVVVLGTPLPPIPGRELWLCESLLLPAGLDFETPLLALLLARKLNPHNDALLLFSPTGEWERVERRFLLPASRSAVRLTLGNPAHA
ncbi:hypothetical protein J0X19_09120 [Hymenobacter sp. BT186]|uniref:MoxR-vWA-beta-propeller ternary system domain-containing protein n=1 Tax=Hymenobacter telluris TaxID=2816474 RepID=A0A939EWX3_9BACT|nr:hypothetical protein [Hymenobacter telluris]MBO0358102.1 hypothetical protein [Hymenobacter telluris]MBW3374129.1 hypothetical protein [Hymenobacter norwichensis]